MDWWQPEVLGSESEELHRGLAAITMGQVNTQQISSEEKIACCRTGDWQRNLGNRRDKLKVPGERSSGAERAEE